MGFGQQESSSKSGSESFSFGRAKTPLQEQYLDQSLNLYGPTLGRGQAGYEGQRVAGMSNLQLSTLDQASNLLSQVGQPSALRQETGGALQQLLTGQGGAELISPERASQVFEQTRAAPRRATFGDEGIPLIREQFAGPGFFGTAKGKAITEEGRRLEKDIATERESFMFDTENINRQLQEDRANRALAAVGPTLEFARQPLQDQAAQLSLLSGAYELGSQEQIQRQAEISSAMDQFIESQQLTDPTNLSILMALLGLNFSTSQSNASGFGFSSGSGYNVSA